MRTSAEPKERPKRAPRPVMVIEEQANQPIDRYAEALDPIVEPDGTSAVEVKMGLGAILFESQEDGNAGGNSTGGSTPGAECMQKPIGYEKILADLRCGEESRAVTRDQRGVTTLIEAQIQKEVTVIPASYWGLKYWTCRENGHSTFTCPFRNADQHLIFAYRYYLQKVTVDPQKKRYLEEKLQHQVSIYRQKQRIAQRFMEEKKNTDANSRKVNEGACSLRQEGELPIPSVRIRQVREESLTLLTNIQGQLETSGKESMATRRLISHTRI